MIRCVFAAAVLCSVVTPVAAQSGSAPPAPGIRRWLDVQNVHLSSRYRWIESDTGATTSSTIQWQPNVRARVLLDRASRYTVHVGAFGGNQFTSSWNNTGAGIGTYQTAFAIKQLFVAAEPRSGLEFQVGGLYMTRGENTEITSYDNDAFIVGERVTIRRAHGVLSQVAATVGHIGDYRTPNVFKRLDAIADVNYGQLLVAWRLGTINASADYTHEDGRDIFREGVAVRLADAALPLTLVRFDTYQRVSGTTGHGFNVSGELRVGRALAITTGVAHVDRDYLIPGYATPNADRFERGTRFYSQGSYTLTRDLSVGWFHAEAFNVDYAIANERRFEVLVTVNPTATLKARRVF